MDARQKGLPADAFRRPCPPRHRVSAAASDRSVIRARAPLRLGLAGGGTDVSPYCDVYGGAVLNVTIDRYAYATVAPRDDGRTVFRAADLDREEVYDPAAPIRGDGLKLHRGVYARMVERFAGSAAPALTLTTHVDSPMGSGLGSSSALVVAMVQALGERLDAALGEYEVAHLAFCVERRDLALNGGRQDQYAATFGGFNVLEFEADDRVVVNPLRLGAAVAAELEASLVLFSTGASRDSAEIIDAQSASVDAGGSALEAMHQIKREAMAMKEALMLGRLADVAAILERGWEAKKRTSAAVSNARLERLMGLAKANGAKAGKVSGAGGGGFILFLVDPSERPRLLHALRAEPDAEASACSFSYTGARTWRAPG